MKKNNNELFIEKYKELEYVTTKRYNLAKTTSAISFLEKRNEFSDIKKELRYCREIRNFLQHEEKIDNEFAVIASNEMIKLIDKVINVIKNPVTCYDICKKMNDIYYKKLDDYVLDSMISMKHKKFTHIPILENDVVVGVFSKTSIFNYLLDEYIDTLTSSLKFKDIMDYIDVKQENYLFIKKTDTVYDITNIILDYYKQNNRISMIFVTENGKEKDKLIGILTPFDLLKY